LVPDGDDPGSEEVSSLHEARRRIFDQQATITELQLELRRRGYSDVVRDIEERAILRDLDLKAGYLRYLETAVGALNDHIIAVTNDRDAVVGYLRHVEASLAAIQNQRSYRAFLRMMSLLRRTGPLYVVMRLVLRMTLRLRRAFGRLVRRSGK
jgi:hypothetical protein